MVASRNGKAKGARKPVAKRAPAAKRPASKKSSTSTALPENIALVLQGGGALGAYQVGVYQGLHEAGIVPNWIAGISIGAFNTALIAGNPPERRLEALREFWETISQPNLLPATTLGQEARQAPFAAPPPLAFLMGVQSFDHQLALADAALYRGKKSGRNCVQWAGPEDVPGEKPGDQAATTLMA